MITAPIPSNEKERLCALNDLKILDTANEERFDILTQEALERFSVPISTITLVDTDREWFKSVQGMTTKQGPRDISFCGHALMSEVVMIVEDTLLDKRFADNPMVTADPPIRFYAGKSLYHYTISPERLVLKIWVISLILPAELKKRSIKSKILLNF